MPRTSRYDLPPIGAGTESLERVLGRAMLGQLNVAGEIILLGGTGETVLEDPTFSFTTEIILIPRSSAGAATVWWLEARAKGSITIGHDSSGGDRLFGYVAVG